MTANDAAFARCASPRSPGRPGAEPRPQTTTASVLTLVRGRDSHFRFLLEGLARQDRMPDELVIAWMQDERPPHTASLPFPVRHLHVPGSALPLAAARNRAAEAATGDLLVFLDVDCIPAPGLIDAYVEAARQTHGLFLGEVLYLAGGALDDGLDFDRLDRVGVPHPSKPAMPSRGLMPEPDHGQLWGLSFALRRGTYDAVGGMDAGYCGYGGEETDFGARLAEAGVPFFWVAGARAYHQHHAVHVPPLNHFGSILQNAKRFRDRHGRWCMDYWLTQMTAAGFIDWAPERTDISILKHPTSNDIAAARQPDDRRFS